MMKATIALLALALAVAALTAGRSCEGQPAGPTIGAVIKIKGC